MLSFQDKAYNAAKKHRNLFSLAETIDLCFISQKKILLLIKEVDYIEILSFFPLVFSNQKVLFVPSNKNFKNMGPTGFNTVEKHYRERFGFCATNNFNSLKLIICPIESTTLDYLSHSLPVKIDKKTKHNNLVALLKRTGYSCVDYVEELNEFCVKGGMIDFFCPLYQHPVRCDFYEDEPNMFFYDLKTSLPKKGFFGSLWLSKKTKTKKTINILSTLKLINYDVIDFTDYKKTEIDVFPFKKNKFPDKTVNVQTLLNSRFSYNNNVYLDKTYVKKELSTNPNKVASFDIGDLVCHDDFGVGIYKNLITEEGGQEYVQIKYPDGYIRLSVKNLHKLSFVSRETKNETKLNFLNKKKSWEAKKKKIQKEADLYVDKIVNIYTNKKSVERQPFLFGKKIEEDFIKSFEYEDTSDQSKVWEEIKKDFESKKPMSRLLCGDVGFGKTEVAARALFRVAINNKQSIFLVPTSVLATQQHKVLLKRLGEHGVNVGLLRGGLGLNQKNQIKRMWLKKTYDVLVCTTAVFYDDVFISSCSFFIVDEEHRFGVKYKDLFVNSFKNIDVLYLSATPIPRTLHLSLLGFHDISTLSTPPVLRKPIATFVSYFEQKLIKNIVAFELQRGGQVFYLHNKIKTINSVKNYLENLCPAASIGVAHSKLGYKKLKKVFLDFVDKKTNLLLCSSVIGSGVDIPNANTIIVEDSNNFGLSQLHQIRGRVGRGKNQGFAYLLVSKNKKLSSTAKQRLKAIERNSSLGAGYSIAQNDLSIRGGGALFGYKQSGGFVDVGYDYYSKTLSKSFSNLTNQRFVYAVDNFVCNIDFPSFFDKNYIFSDKERIRKIKELASLYSSSSVLVFFKNLVAAFGPPSLSVINLINMRYLTLFCCKLSINKLLFSSGSLSLFFDSSFDRFDVLFSFFKERQSVFLFDRYLFKKQKNYVVVDVSFEQRVRSVKILKNIIEDMYVFCKK